MWAWTYAASQKAVNIARDPRATLQVEAGEAYGELRGVMVEADVVVHGDTADGGASSGRDDVRPLRRHAGRPPGPAADATDDRAPGAQARRAAVRRAAPGELGPPQARRRL